jgi:homoserine dehydrogenase
VSLDVADRPGVLAQVALVFAEHGVSISVVRQTALDREVEAEGASLVGEGASLVVRGASLVIVTHAAPDAALRACVDKLAGQDVVRAVVSVMRVEGEVS